VTESAGVGQISLVCEKVDVEKNNRPILQTIRANGIRSADLLYVFVELCAWRSTVLANKQEFEQSLLCV
jgi:hypothetical protein